MGNLTADPQLKQVTSENIPVCEFSLAVNAGKNKTTFVNCVAWRKAGEIINQYCKKGSKLTVVGPLEIRRYETEKDGVAFTGTAVNVIVEDFEFAGSNPNGSATGTGEANFAKADDSSFANTSTPPSSAPNYAITDDLEKLDSGFTALSDGDPF